MSSSPFPVWPRFSIDPQGRAFVPPRLPQSAPAACVEPFRIPAAHSPARSDQPARTPAAAHMPSLDSRLRAAS
ncbi:MAG: hypothetical protein B9S34_11255 [Opitutia bacterium Tous-C1TDCM]|nr:MAG: hypothetical protein B9S34_11255 [Opitutae bacterium Tous-C1TDCM]